MSLYFTLGIVTAVAIFGVACLLGRCASINEMGRDQAEADAEQADSIRAALEVAKERRRIRAGDLS